MTALEEATQELGPYTEVSDTLILAAVERALHHQQEDEVLSRSSPGIGTTPCEEEP